MWKLSLIPLFNLALLKIYFFILQIFRWDKSDRFVLCHFPLAVFCRCHWRWCVNVVFMIYGFYSDLFARFRHQSVVGGGWHKPSSISFFAVLRSHEFFVLHKLFGLNPHGFLVSHLSKWLQWIRRFFFKLICMTIHDDLVCLWFPSVSDEVFVPKWSIRCCCYRCLFYAYFIRCKLFRIFKCTRTRKQIYRLFRWIVGNEFPHLSALRMNICMTWTGEMFVVVNFRIFF